MIVARLRNWFLKKLNADISFPDLFGRGMNICLSDQIPDVVKQVYGRETV